MNIIEKTYTLNGTLTKRAKTNMIILHHRAGNGDAESIDRIHKGNGWTCIGYHFYVRKDGSIYRGRKEDTIGAHAYGSNSTSIGICAEGNFEVETMPEAQKQSIIELVNYLKNKYGVTKVIRHKDVNATACPGKNYPYNEIINAKITPTAPTKVTGKIADIQRTLNSRYGFNIVVDNIAGNQTKKAIVMALQIELNKQYNKGLKVDGIFGNQTKSACVTLRKGAQGNITWLLQARLVCLGYNTNGVDGVFANYTLAAVKQFQKAVGTLADGIVGRVTWGKLFA